MLIRTSLSRLLVIAAVVTTGCSSESRYNEPADTSKDAAAIGEGTTPQRRVGVGKTKVTKPPGPVTKDKSLKPLA
jgi:hypothetical protein